MTTEAEARRPVRSTVDLAADHELQRRANLYKQDPVRVVATSNITLSGRQTIDGVAVVPGNRVLVTGQSTGANNGLYECRDNTWFRCIDGEHSDMLRKGTTVYVQEGTTYAATTWTLTTLNVVLGTTAQTWTQASSGGGTLAGDVTGPSGSNSIAARAVTYAKMQAVSATARILGRTTSGAGDVEELTAAQAKALLAITSTDISDFNTAVRANRLDQMAAPTAPVIFGGTYLQQVASPFYGDDAANKNYVDLRAPLSRTVNAQTGTTYTLVLADSSALVTLSNASAVTLTIPTNASVAIPVGSEVVITGIGAGLVTVAAAGGVTINNPTGASLTLAQYQVARLVKIATNTWEVNKGSRPPDGTTLTVNASGQLGVPTGGIASTQILDGTILNADINASAAIAASKIALDTDGTLAANSDTVIASQKATKTYADTKLSTSTAAATYAPIADPTFTTKITTPKANVSGSTGAASAVALIGGTTTGAPTTGTHVAGEVAVALDGYEWVCTVGGTPGNWRRLGQSTMARPKVSSTVYPGWPGSVGYMGTGNASVSLNTDYFQTFEVTRPITITDVSCSTTATNAGKTAYVGIVNLNDDMQPSGAVAQQSTVDLSASGVHTWNPTTLTLDAGHWAVCWNLDVTANFVYWYAVGQPVFTDTGYAGSIVLRYSKSRTAAAFSGTPAWDTATTAGIASANPAPAVNWQMKWTPA